MYCAEWHHFIVTVTSVLHIPVKYCGCCRKMVLLPDEGEDMWHTYNIIMEGDRLRASTIRKVQQASVTGSSTSSRVRTTITIQVEAITFDTGACMLRWVPPTSPVFCSTLCI